MSKVHRAQTLLLLQKKTFLLIFPPKTSASGLDVWVSEFGIDAMYAIKSATYWPAKIIGVDHETGTVSEGKYADIIAVKGDVLRHIALLQDVDLVIRQGERYK